MKALSESTVAIIGLGLMGGSLARSLQANPGAVASVVGIDWDRAAIAGALEAGAIARGEAEEGEWLSQADLVVLATPVRDILARLARLGDWLRPGALVLDLGSTKMEIVRAMGKLPLTVFAVGGHPMCGKETSGWPASDPFLYRDKLFILVPTARSSEEALETAAALARAVGARPVRMEAERHDSIVAAVSHVPYLVAANLAAAADEWASAEPELESVASSGFADTTRLAASSVDMMLDILLTNRAAIVERLRELSRAQNELIDCIAEGDEAVLRKRLAQAAARRRTWKGGPAHE